MKAVAAVSADRGPDGRSRLVRLRSQPPFTLRRTRNDSDWLDVQLVGSAAGPLGGDDLTLEVSAESGVALRLRSTAAQVVLPGETGVPARVGTVLRIAGDSAVDVRFEPTVLAAGSLLHSRVEAELSDESTLLIAETTVLGRHGETVPGQAVQRWQITRGGAPLLRTTLSLLDPKDYRSPALLGPAGVITSLLAVAPKLDAPPRALPGRGAVHVLDQAALVTVLGEDPVAVAQDLAELTADWLPFSYTVTS